MEPIFNKKAVKSLFKAPRGQKSPPPPPPPHIYNNCSFKVLISYLFLIILIISIPSTVASQATVSISTSGPFNDVESPSSSSGSFNIIIIPRRTGVPVRVCFSSSLPTPSFQLARGLSTLTLEASGCADVVGSGESTIQFSAVVYGNDDTLDEPDEVITMTVSEDPDNKLPSDVTISTTANTASITIRDDDPTIVTLARTGNSTAVDEGGTSEFTITLGRALIAVEIIDVPLAVSGTSITTADWSLAVKSGATLNTGITLVNETTAAPVVRFSGAGAQTATLLLTAVADNTAETGGSEVLTLALGPNDATANGFDLNTRNTNVGGGADPATEAANNTFNVTINDTDTEAPMPSLQSLDTIDIQCELTKTQLDRMTPTATDNHPGVVTVTNNIGKFPITSDTTITWTYTDASNNTATQTQEVTIKDTINPVPNPDNDLSTLTADCSIPAADVTIPTAMDNCDGTITATTNVTPPITASTTIMWTYRDAAGNTATQTQEVVIDDDMPPTPNPSNNLSEITRQCLLRESELTTPAATDNCTGSVTVTNNIANFPITSDTTITWTYTDGVNNTVTQTQQVTIDDTTDPVPLTADLPMLEDCLQITTLTAPTATDNCDGIIMGTTTTTPPTMTSTTLTWIYRDVAGNMTTQMQQVTIGDTEAPMPEVSDLPTLTGDVLLQQWLT